MSRNEEILQRRLGGETIRGLAKAFHISKTRIYQILHQRPRYHPVWGLMNKRAIRAVECLGYGSMSELLHDPPTPESVVVQKGIGRKTLNEIHGICDGYGEESRCQNAALNTTAF